MWHDILSAFSPLRATGRRFASWSSVIWRPSEVNLGPSTRPPPYGFYLHVTSSKAVSVFTAELFVGAERFSTRRTRPFRGVWCTSRENAVVGVAQWEHWEARWSVYSRSPETLKLQPLGAVCAQMTMRPCTSTSSKYVYRSLVNMDEKFESTAEWIVRRRSKPE